MNDIMASDSSNDKAQIVSPKEAPLNEQGRAINTDGLDNPQKSQTSSTSPEEELEKKKAELQTAKDNISALQAVINTLQAKTTELQAATAGYDKFYTDSTQKLADAKTKINEKKKMALSVIDGEVAKNIDEKVNKKIADFENTLKGMKDNQVDPKRQDVNNARTASSQADNALHDQQLAFTKQKKQPKNIEASVIDLQNLIAETEKAHDRDDHTQMYLLAQIAMSLSEKISIPTLDDYKKSLLNAQTDTEQKLQDAAKKKNDAEQKSKELSDLIKNYEAKVESSRTDLLKSLKEINPAAG